MREARRGVSVESVVSLIGAGVAVVFGVIGIWQAQEARRAADSTAEQSFLVTQQAELLTQLETFARLVETGGDAMSGAGEALADAKALQRSARDAIFVGDYARAKAEIAEAFAILAANCPLLDTVTPKAAGEPESILSACGAIGVE